MNRNRLRHTSEMSAIMCAAALLLYGATGCDDGKIYPDDSEIASTGLGITLKGDLSGCGKYSGGDYIVALAAFEDGSDFAAVSKNLSDGNEDVTISNVSRKVASVEVCIINRLRKRVLTLASEKIDGASASDIIFNVGELDTAPFAAITNGIFSTTCLQCHGGTETPAAGLSLLPEKAYSDIVNVHSKVVEGEMIVNPGNASASTLWQAVATDLSESWRFDHSNLLSNDRQIFIENWINSGAND